MSYYVGLEKFEKRKLAQKIGFWVIMSQKNNQKAMKNHEKLKKLLFRHLKDKGKFFDERGFL